MENYCSVTGELREWAKKLTHWWYDPVKDEYTYTMGTMPPSTDAVRLDERLVAIADRIDAEYEADVSTVCRLTADGWWVYVDRTGRRPDKYRHHHEPTVEDVLREFANECLTYATCVDDHEVTDAIELYAAKLQLRGDKQ